jgi:hypothetical protein
MISSIMLWNCCRAQYFQTAGNNIFIG